MPSHYAALGLPRDFAPELLKKNFRALAMRWHPDRNHGNEEEATEKFKAINEAYTVLSDPERRRKYDVELMMRRHATAAARSGATPRGPTPPSRTQAPAGGGQTRPSVPKPMPTPASAPAPSTPRASAVRPSVATPASASEPAPPPPPPKPKKASPGAGTAAAETTPQRPPTYPLPTDPREPLHRRAEVAPEKAAPALSPDVRAAPPGRAAPRQDTTGPSGGAGAEWADLQEALEASEREAHERSNLEQALAASEREAREQARREEEQALESVRLAEEREAAEIVEALRMVEEAIKREAEEEMMASFMHGGACKEDTTAFTTDATGDAAAERQLAALMELGFHAALAAPLCDGVTPLEELVERLMPTSTTSTSSTECGGTGRSAHPGRGRSPPVEHGWDYSDAAASAVAARLPSDYAGDAVPNRSASFLDPYPGQEQDRQPARTNSWSYGVAKRLGLG